MKETEKKKLWFVNNSEYSLTAQKQHADNQNCQIVNVFVYTCDCIQSKKSTLLNRFNTHTYANHVDIVGEI